MEKIRVSAALKGQKYGRNTWLVAHVASIADIGFHGGKTTGGGYMQNTDVKRALLGDHEVAKL